MRLIFSFLALAQLAGGILFTLWQQETLPAGEDPVSAVPASAAAPVEDEDTRCRRLVVGVWQDDYQGKRTMTLKADGTGIMLVELSGIRALLAAPRLKFDMTWTIEGKRLKKRTVGGEPAGKVQMILKTMGDQVDEPILELTQDRLLLLDKDGKTKYDWRCVRVKNGK